MKSHFKLLAAVLSFSLLGGCVPKSREKLSESSQTASESASLGISSVTPETPSAPEESAPTGEPTFLIGLDGKAILTSEITKLENTDKTAEMLSEGDVGAMALCEGFAYMKEPAGIAYGSYANPELFDAAHFDFFGEMPENTNDWKRVYVGDEICGLKLKSASSLFYVNDNTKRTFPERFYSHYDPMTMEPVVCEFEGTITIDGFLSINHNSVQYPLDNEWISFTPAEDKLPVMAGNIIDNETGYKTDFGFCTPYTSQDFACLNENSNIKLGCLKDVTCDMGGLGTGDLAYVRATFGNLTCAANTYTATLENVELLSGILAHIEDDTTGGHGTLGI